MKLCNYPNYEKIHEYIELITRTCSLKYEYQAEGVDNAINNLEQDLKTYLKTFSELSINEELKSNEPDDLEMIRKMRPEGPRQLKFNYDRTLYREKLSGALYTRVAGCLLGSIVENWSIDEMEKWAIEIGDAFPPIDYWSQAKAPLEQRYLVSKCFEYTKNGMKGAPADDDIIYIIATLMILEKYGINFKTSDVGDYWYEYLPWIYIDMEYPLNKCKKDGVSAWKAADENPYGQLICPYIRIDGYGWICPGNPEKAAELAYRDAYMSHRRNGIYGAMLFAAAEAAAYVVDDPIEAIRIGLTEIPKDCTLARFINEALNDLDQINTYRDARKWVDDRTKGMDRVHTINNACLTVFALHIGRTDTTKVISQSVAMGLDNDCNAATAGSIAGAIAGISNIESHWITPMQNRIHTYIKDNEYVCISDIIERYITVTEKYQEWGK